MTTATAPTARPVAVGDRVMIEHVDLGETIQSEVVVIQVDEDGERGTRIIGRPEGCLSLSFARYEWTAL